MVCIVQPPKVASSDILEEILVENGKRIGYSKPLFYFDIPVFRIVVSTESAQNFGLILTKEGWTTLPEHCLYLVDIKRRKIKEVESSYLYRSDLREGQEIKNISIKEKNNLIIVKYRMELIKYEVYFGRRMGLRKVKKEAIRL